VELYLLPFHWALKAFFNSVPTTTTYFPCRPWFISTAFLALYSEFFPHSDAYLLWLFSLFACCGTPPSVSTWRKDWWNVEKFLQWFIPKLMALLTLR
jgi:hypothetical protein